MMIKDVKDLKPYNSVNYNDEEAEQSLSQMIQTNEDNMDRYFYVYKKENFEDAYDMRYEYISRHRKELESKGYKVHKLLFEKSYRISWRKND